MKKLFVLILVGLMACKKEKVEPVTPPPSGPVVHTDEVKIRVISYGLGNPTVRITWDYDYAGVGQDSVYLFPNGYKIFTKRITSDSVKVRPLYNTSGTTHTCTYDFTVYVNGVGIDTVQGDAGGTYLYKVR